MWLDFSVTNTNLKLDFCININIKINKKIKILESTNNTKCSFQILKTKKEELGNHFKNMHTLL